MIFHLSRSRPSTTELLTYEVAKKVRRTLSRPPNRSEHRARTKH